MKKSGTDIILSEAVQDPLMHYSNRFAQRFAEAATKIHRFYDLQKCRPKTTAFATICFPVRLAMHASRLFSGNRELVLGRLIEKMSVKELSTGLIDSRYIQIEPKAIKCAYWYWHNNGRGWAYDYKYPIVVTYSKDVARCYESDHKRFNEAEKLWDNPHKQLRLIAIDLDDIKSPVLDKNVCDMVAKHYWLSVLDEIKIGRFVVKNNNRHANDAVSLLAALIHNPSLDPMDFVTKNDIKKRRGISGIDIDLPDQEKTFEKLDKEIETLRANPTSLGFTRFGNDEAVASGQAISALSQWQTRQGISLPISFEYWEELSAAQKSLQSYAGGDIVQALEADKNGQIKAEIKEMIEGLTHMVALVSKEVGEDIGAVTQQMEAEEKAKSILFAHMQITGKVRDLFDAALPDLKKATAASPNGEITGDEFKDQPRFTPSSLDIKARSLQQTALLAKQKFTALSQSTGSVGEAIILSLPQLMNDAQRFSLMLQKLNDYMDDEQFKAHQFAREFRRMNELTERWDSTIGDVAGAIKQIENGEEPRLMITDQSGLLGDNLDMPDNAVQLVEPAQPVIRLAAQPG